MGSIRRWACWCVISLVLAAVAAYTPAASASASTAPVQMNYACAVKVVGLMSYVSSPTKCKSIQTEVTIVPGPHYVCVGPAKSVFLVASLSDCRWPENVVSIPK